MKIAYVSTYDLRDSSTWSKFNRGNYGSNQFIAAALTHAALEIDYIGPLEKGYRWLTRLKWLYYHHLKKQAYYSWADQKVCQHYAAQIQQKLKLSTADIVLVTEGAYPVGYLKCDRPLVLWIDTFFAELIDYYPYLKNLCAETKQSILIYEQQAIDRCALIIVTSQWAKDCALKHYTVSPEKIIVLPRGANIELAPDRTLKDIQLLIDQRSATQCRLLFSGMDWHRKGGDVALKVAEWLNQNGVKTELVVLGCQPPVKTLPDFVTVAGYVDKSTPDGQQALLDLVASAHFLILPTRQDCTPNVLIEANAFGVPCLTTNLAGIPSIIQDGVNGKLFETEAAIADYGNFVRGQMQDRSAYESLAKGAFLTYQQRLNWATIGQQATAYFEQLITV
ncbi:MAG TPA: glycosyltransferase family 4 protein [Candidatus Obscuribacterales bacterium]